MSRPGRQLVYVHDPMCSWCWAFRPVWAAIRSALPGDIRVSRLLGGLAADTTAAMPLEMQQGIRGIWATIQQRVPGTEFNFDFWKRCRPRRATFPACRAVIAAREQSPAFEASMIRAIQQAYYLQARNPSDGATLIELAGELGVDRQRFARDLESDRIQALLRDEIRRARLLGADSFPSLVLMDGGGHRLLQLDYRDPGVVLAQLA